MVAAVARPARPLTTFEGMWNRRPHRRPGDHRRRSPPSTCARHIELPHVVAHDPEPPGTNPCSALVAMGVPAPGRRNVRALREGDVRPDAGRAAGELPRDLRGVTLSGSNERDVPGYLDETGVAEGSSTETFVALRCRSARPRPRAASSPSTCGLCKPKRRSACPSRIRIRRKAGLVSESTRV